MGGQSAPHKRGGTHRVKDEDKTNSKFDEYKYQQLKDECLARKIYVKDMKKSEMAKALAANEQEVKRAEHVATKERERKQQQLQREKAAENAQRQRAYAERQRRRRQKEERREREESVSEDTPDEEELQMMKDMFNDHSDRGDQEPVGHALSEESWESTSTETVSSCTKPGVQTDCKLRLFEWTYAEMPSPTARSGPRSFPDESSGYWNDSKVALRTHTVSSDSGEDEDDETAMSRRTLPISRNVPYAPVKVHTTESKEKVFFPGQTYPPGIDADYVPILPEHTRRAARNGVLEGVLRCATIEPATAWFTRTRLQGWNAHMFFTLPPANEAKSLLNVYDKWFVENRRLLRVKPRGDALRGERTARHAQRHGNKRKKQAEVFKVSRYRPTAVCYLPAYLDFHTNGAQLEDDMQYEVRDLSHLYYIRFPGCDVPHYYFWTREGEWADPTRPNPDRDSGFTDETPRHSQLAAKRLPGAPGSSHQHPVRIKRCIEMSVPASPSSSANTAKTVSRIEYELYQDGLKSTIYKYRTKWREASNSDAWEVFGRALPVLYPSGALPTVPPVHLKAKISVASKIASIELGHSAETFTGDEPWTSKDDEWWDVINVGGESGEVEHCHEDVEQDLNELNPRDMEALYRRASVQVLYTAMEACKKWLEDVGPDYVPLSPDSMLDSRDEWETMVFDHGRGFSHAACPFCMQNLGDLAIDEQAEHMYRHSSLPPIRDQIGYRSSTTIYDKHQDSYRLSTAVHVEMIDTYDDGAEADSEKWPKRSLTNVKTSKRRERSFPHPSIDQHTMSHRLPDVSSKQNRAALNFLSQYSPPAHPQIQDRACLPQTSASNSGSDVLHRKPSAPSAPTHKKRKKVAGKTYRAHCSSSNSDADYIPLQFVPAKKRRKIADPTYRDVAGDMSSDEDATGYHRRRGKTGKARKSRRVVEGTSEGLQERTGESNGSEETIEEMVVRGGGQDVKADENDMVGRTTWCAVM